MHPKGEEVCSDKAACHRLGLHPESVWDNYNLSGSDRELFCPCAVQLWVLWMSRTHLICGMRAWRYVVQAYDIPPRACGTRWLEVDDV